MISVSLSPRPICCEERNAGLSEVDGRRRGLASDNVSWQETGFSRTVPVHPVRERERGRERGRERERERDLCIVFNVRKSSGGERVK